MIDAQIQEAFDDTIKYQKRVLELQDFIENNDGRRRIVKEAKKLIPTLQLLIKVREPALHYSETSKEKAHC